MASFVGALAAGYKSASNPAVAYPATVNIGDLIVVYISTDSTGNPTVTDGANTFTVTLDTTQSYKLYKAYAIATSSRTTANSITVGNTTGASVTCFTGAVFRPGANEVFYRETSDNLATYASSTTPSSTQANAQGGRVLIGVHAMVGPTGDTFTADADTTNGSWSTVVTGTSATATLATATSTTQTIRLGSSGGNAASNTVVTMQYKLPSAAGSQTYNPTLGNARAGIIGMVEYTYTDFSIVSTGTSLSTNSSAAGNISLQAQSTASSLSTTSVGDVNQRMAILSNALSSSATSSAEGKFTLTGSATALSSSATSSAQTNATLTLVSTALSSSATSSADTRYRYAILSTATSNSNTSSMDTDYRFAILSTATSSSATSSSNVNLGLQAVSTATSNSNTSSMATNYRYAILSTGTSSSAASSANTDALGTYKDVFIGWGVGG